MSNLLSSPCKINPKQKRIMAPVTLKLEDNNNTNTLKCSERNLARAFISWYKSLIDNDRPNLGLYLAENASLEWFGRTIRTQKKVAAFLKYDMQCTRHDFRTIESIEAIQTRQDRISRQSVSHDDTVLATSLISPHSPEIVRSGRNKRRPGLRSCSSPEWDSPEAKRKKLADDNYGKLQEEMNKGDGVITRSGRRKCELVTPPNCEVGQGDCLASTSAETRQPKTCHPLRSKKAVECTGYIEFTRTKNNRDRGVDNMKWERKCKVQISYSEDPYNVGEYILWAIHYTDESKCRRNLLAAFEEVANEIKKDSF